MRVFNTARDAKEYLVSQIVAEADREGAPLSEVERKMLFFTETAWTLPDIRAVSDAFDRDYDQADYEAKIAGIVENARLASGDPDAWDEAVRILRSEDHYLTVLIDAGTNGVSGSPGYRFADRFKLVATAAAVIALMLVAQYFLRR